MALVLVYCTFEFLGLTAQATAWRRSAAAINHREPAVSADFAIRKVLAEEGPCC